MRPNTLLLAQLILLPASTYAFFPFQPLWLEEIEEKNAAGEARRSVGDSAADGVSFEIKQRRGQRESASQSQKAAWQASLLSHKYHPGRSSTSATDDTLARRDNQYSVMQAVDPDQPKTAGMDQDGTDYSYFIQVQLGSKSTELYMLIDTGAGSSWVPGTNCTSQACSLHNSFGPSDSTTFESSSDDFSISYGSGAVQGTLATDTITVAGMSLTYQFGLASNTSSDFVHFAFDGILGLSMNDGANQNFLQALADSKLLDKNIFGIALNRAADGTNTGEIKFGSTNPAKYTGSIGYTPIVSGEDWSIQLDDMAFNGKKAGVGGIPAYIDTGTSYIFGPPKNVKALHSVIPGATSSDGVTYTVPCDSNTSVTITFSGVNYEISPKDWVSPKDNTGQCTSNFYGYEVVSGSWLLGDTFLKNVYAVFDKDQRRIGFAQRATGGSGSSSSSDSSLSPTATTKGASASATTFSTGITSAGDPTTSPTPPALGLSGHETSGTTAETAQPTSTSSAAGSRLQGIQLGLVACVLPFLFFY